MAERSQVRRPSHQCAAAIRNVFDVEKIALVIFVAAAAVKIMFVAQTKTGIAAVLYNLQTLRQRKGVTDTFTHTAIVMFCQGCIKPYFP